MNNVFSFVVWIYKKWQGKKKRKEIIIIWLDKRSEKKKYNYYQMTILPSYKYVYITNLTDIFKHTVYIIKKIILVFNENIQLICKFIII